MKILVLSLLRLGDLIQQKSVLEGLRRRYPGAEIEVVVNPGSLAAKEVIPTVDRWIVFHRDRWQQMLGTAEQHILRPVREVREMIADLSRNGYDHIFNLTHNRLSAFLCEAVHSSNKHGLVSEELRFRPFENEWIRHLNQRMMTASATPFHYVDLWTGAFQIETHVPRRIQRGQRIFFQPLTSEDRKNWGLAKWANLARMVKSQYPDFSITILGAAFEEERLKAHFDSKDLLIGNLQEVRSAFSEAALLITGDTSIMHLAAADGVPIVALALGGSDAYRTGPYVEGAYVLQGKTANEIEGHQVMHAVNMQFGRESLRASDAFLETRVIGPEWIVAKVGDENDAAKQWMARRVWRRFLDDDTSPIVLPEELKSIDMVALHASAVELRRVCDRFTEFRRVAMESCAEEGFQSPLFESFRRELKALKAWDEMSAAELMDLIETGEASFAHPLALLGQAHRALEALRARCEIRTRFFQSFIEHGGSYERIPGKSSVGGSEASGDGSGQSV